MSRGKRWALRIGIALGVLLLGLGIAIGTMDRWLFVALDPGAFDPSATPPAPDYAEASSWAARPESGGGAEVALPEHPATDPQEAPADVFYVHPTTWLGGEWNGAFDDPQIAQATERGGTLIQASAFNACCAIYAPRYRQANGRALTRPDAIGARAIEVAYGDVSAAFDAFLERTGARPFLIAGHSQGAVHAARLVRERVAGQPLEARLVAAYLPGAPVLASEIGLPVCERPEQTGCVVSWNARGPGFAPNGFELRPTEAGAMARRVCVNPISWRADGRHVAASQSAGAVFFDTERPRVKAAFADAQCVDGSLVIRQMGDPERDLASRLLLYVMGPGNYHPIEYQLFYLDLRANARARVAAFLREG